MSRTHHRTHEDSHRNSPRSKLTKGPGAGEYSKSEYDYHDGGGNHNWILWIRSYLGYGKQKKRRRLRKVMKRLGRRMFRRRGDQELRDELEEI